MIVILIALIVASICVQVPNLLGVHAATDPQGLSLYRASVIAAFSLPAGYLASVAYILFYGRGSLYLSYPLLALSAMTAIMAIALVVQYVMMPSRGVSLIEAFGLAIAVSGILVAIFHERISTAFFHSAP
ncbi:hypothetical protein [Marinimicrobium sp. ABcell2]|uniref:hypothetical protein n=1 Tax=Marinimicrobium sp. ABcell2 TaxID=3069751 RepID=UPI0027B49046|nr:hypothetical protein [Marinimicrobium sp. ABcell2]MDQ2077402.1 hypothetical protein [Marinimicrobium sp. ABcell2]